MQSTIIANDNKENKKQLKEGSYVIATVEEVAISYEDNEASVLKLGLQKIEIVGMLRQNNVKTMICISLGSHSLKLHKRASSSSTPRSFALPSTSDAVPVVSSLKSDMYGGSFSRDERAVELKLLTDTSASLFGEKKILVALGYLGVTVEPAIVENLLAIGEKVQQIRIGYYESLHNDAEAQFLVGNYYKDKGENYFDRALRCYVTSAKLCYREAILLLAKRPRNGQEHVFERSRKLVEKDVFQAYKFEEEEKLVSHRGTEERIYLQTYVRKMYETCIDRYGDLEAKFELGLYLQG